MGSEATTSQAARGGTTHLPLKKENGRGSRQSFTSDRQTEAGEVLRRLQPRLEVTPAFRFPTALRLTIPPKETGR